MFYAQFLQLRKLVQFPLSKQVLVLKVAFVFLLIRLGLGRLSFRRVQETLRWLARFVPRWQAGPTDRALILLVTARLGAAWLKNRSCLTEALTVQFFFARRGYEANLRIGVTKESTGKLIAHAWVESAGQIVIGGAESPIVYNTLPPLPQYQ